MKVLEVAKVHLEDGRPDLVVAELPPLLLDEDSIAGKGAFSRPKSALEGLQVLQVGVTLVRYAIIWACSM